MKNSESISLGGPSWGNTLSPHSSRIEREMITHYFLIYHFSFESVWLGLCGESVFPPSWVLLSAIKSALTDFRLRYRAWNSRLSQLNNDIENLQYRLKITRTSHLTSITEKSNSKFQEILHHMVWFISYEWNGVFKIFSLQTFLDFQ